MRYCKSIIVGMATAVVASATWVLAVFVLPIFLPVVVSRFTGAGGMSASSVSSGSVLAAAVGGFLVGFVWHFRRASTHAVR